MAKVQRRLQTSGIRYQFDPHNGKASLNAADLSVSGDPALRELAKADSKRFEFVDTKILPRKMNGDNDGFVDTDDAGKAYKKGMTDSAMSAFLDLSADAEKEAGTQLSIRCGNFK